MKMLEYITILHEKAKQRTLTETEMSVIDLWNLSIKLKAENETIKSKADEVFGHTLWVAMELGKALQKCSELREEMKALKENRD